MDPLWILLIGMAVVVGGILAFRLHAFIALMAGALLVAALTPAASIEKFALEGKKSPAEAKKLAQTSIGERVAREFGDTAGKIGILIAMAAIIGKCLLDSGAADKIIRSFLRALGEKRAALAFTTTGFTLGIPVFFDTVFYLMIPLGKALAARTKQNYLLYVLTIITGTTMAHSLVPPTPGPLFVGEKLNINIGAMMLGGIAVGLVTAGFGYFFAHWVNRRHPIPLRETADVSLAELESLSQRDERELPPFWLALAPILLPVILIGGDAVFVSLLKGAESIPAWMSSLAFFFNKLGDKNIALIISAVIALGTLIRYRKLASEDLRKAMESALASGGLIILITSAGGAFGGVLQQTGIGGRIEEIARQYHIAVLPLAFFVTALIRAAQGSATVAMITAVGIVGGMAAQGQLGFHPIYLALAIGCGSKPFPWMNDSGFWVICKMSGLTEKEMLRTFSVMLTLMGFVGLAVTLLLAKFFPFV
ncbi:MAG: SLC13 family permease [Verrucomicrobiota bacterium]